MAWNLTDDVETFEAAAGGFLRSRPAEHTVLLTVTATLRESGTTAFGDEPPHFGWWTGAGGAVGGAFVRTPPRPLLLSPLSADAAASLAGLWDTAEPPPGVTADLATAWAFADAWRDRTGATVSVHRNIRLYRLGALRQPDPMPAGRVRTGTATDRELLVRWFHAFSVDLGGREFVNADRQVVDRIGYGGLSLWEVDGTPVSLAGISRTVAGTARVSPVYTPADLRGRGYAGAATAAVSRAALDAGAEEVVLFTDLANPTSNALYRRIGYEPVVDRVALDFDL
ncbi:GNAT family N-acetyltransferase [Streptomyces sp. NBC_01537]|uniref:GNAT family N-acetyltransferase n=1 Tax=Streptomyces sp. NBC_01537 TaxID=2903896 RepID=UPI00386D6B0F